MKTDGGLNQMRYLVVIPARGGSKGIPYKNIYKVAGKPLIEYAIESMREVSFEGELAVSTDDDQIATVAAKYDDVIVIKRPSEISHDTAKTEAALIHALQYMKDNYEKDYDAIVTLQPTSPLRKGYTIQRFLETFEKNIDKYDALLTLSEDRSDFWIQKEDGSYCRLFPDAPRRRQERRPLYVENSAIYVTLKESLLECNSVLGQSVNGFVIDAVEGVDINEFVDIAVAESLLFQQMKGENI